MGQQCTVCRNPLYRGDKQRQKLKEELSKMNKIGGVSHFSFISLFQNLTCLIHILCMHHMKGKVGKVCWERQQPLLRGVAQGSSINALVPPQLLQHIAAMAALELERPEFSLVGNKFLNKNLSSLYDMRIKLINGENYCIVKLQQ